jgi:membrane protein DedA with SNARE-associated domain
MEAVSDWLIAFVSEQDNPFGLLVLAGSALIEYVFPPFPGDTITLFGAVLITAHDWNFAAVYASVLLGSVGGSLLAFYFGGAIQRRRARADGAIDRLIERFERHGPIYLVVNRFLPGFRAVFFVAAGLANMPVRAVVVYGLVSAALWNLLIIGVGSAIGANFETLESWLTRYMIVVWITAGAATLLLAARYAWRRSRRGPLSAAPR